MGGQQQHLSQICVAFAPTVSAAWNWFEQIWSPHTFTMLSRLCLQLARRNLKPHPTFRPIAYLSQKANQINSTFECVMLEMRAETSFFTRKCTPFGVVKSPSNFVRMSSELWRSRKWCHWKGKYFPLTTVPMETVGNAARLKNFKCMKGCVETAFPLQKP